MGLGQPFAGNDAITVRSVAKHYLIENKKSFFPGIAYLKLITFKGFLAGTLLLFGNDFVPLYFSQVRENVTTVY